MSTTFSSRIPSRTGLEQGGAYTDKIHVSPSEGQFGYLGENHISRMEGKVMAIQFGGAGGYGSSRFIETKDNSSTIAYGALGLKFQTNNPAVDNDDVGITSQDSVVLVPNKIYKVLARQQHAESQKMGFRIGFGGGFASTSQPEAFTACNDAVMIQKNNGSANVYGSVIQNGAGAQNTGTLLTITAATDFVVGFEFVIGVDATGVATAGLCRGLWWINGVPTNFTSAQLTALAALYNTTPPTLQAHHGFRVSSTVQRSVDCSYWIGEVDR
jgi:hypothetical protein